MVTITVLTSSTDPDTDPQEFQVTVEDTDKSKTAHKVRVTKETHQRLTGGMKGMEELVRVSFEFLLEREPKESILPSFNLFQIQEYFPEYETVISAQASK